MVVEKARVSVLCKLFDRCRRNAGGLWGKRQIPKTKVIEVLYFPGLQKNSSVFLESCGFVFALGSVIHFELIFSEGQSCYLDTLSSPFPPPASCPSAPSFLFLPPVPIPLAFPFPPLLFPLCSFSLSPSLRCWLVAAQVFKHRFSKWSSFYHIVFISLKCFKPVLLLYMHVVFCDLKHPSLPSLSSLLFLLHNESPSYLLYLLFLFFIFPCFLPCFFSLPSSNPAF